MKTPASGGIRISVMGGDVRMSMSGGRWYCMVSTDHPAWVTDADEQIIVNAAVREVRGC